MFDDAAILLYSFITEKFWEMRNNLIKYFDFDLGYIWGKRFKQIGLVSWLQKELFQGFTFITVRNFLLP